jgi:hydrogenase-4 component B
VEYIHHLADHGMVTWPYTAVEWLFLLSGGLTFSYMARLFYILFLAPPSHMLHESHGGYMEWPTKLVLSAGGLLMPVLGLTAHRTMEPIASLAVDFFRQHDPAHAVHYFAGINLKGAVISIAIGCAVFYGIGWRWLTRRKKNGEEHYLNRTPALDMEEHIYRPLLRLLSLLGGAVARLVESITAGAIFGAVDLLYYRARKTVTPSNNEDFAGYTKERKHTIIQQSFSSDLLCAALGIIAFVILILVIV